MRADAVHRVEVVKTRWWRGEALRRKRPCLDLAWCCSVATTTLTPGGAEQRDVGQVEDDVAGVSAGKQIDGRE